MTRILRKAQFLLVGALLFSAIALPGAVGTTQARVVVCDNLNNFPGTVWAGATTLTGPNGSVWHFNGGTVSAVGELTPYGPPHVTIIDLPVVSNDVRIFGINRGGNPVAVRFMNGGALVALRFILPTGVPVVRGSVGAPIDSVVLNHYSSELTIFRVCWDD